MFSASTLCFFPCVRKLKKWGTKIPQTGRNISQIHQKCSPGDPLGGQGGSRRRPAGREPKQHKKLHIFNAHRIAFGAFSVPLMPKLVPFWTPLDFEAVQKGSNFLQNQYKVWKNYDQERFQKKHQNLTDFRCQNGKHEKVEKRFSHDTCCVLRGFAGSRNSMKNGRPNVMKNPWKLTHWASLGGIVEIWVVFGRPRILCFS